MTKNHADDTWFDCFLGILTIAACVFFYYGTVVLAAGAK